MIQQNWQYPVKNELKFTIVYYIFGQFIIGFLQYTRLYYRILPEQKKRGNFGDNFRNLAYISEIIPKVTSFFARV